MQRKCYQNKIWLFCYARLFFEEEEGDAEADGAVICPREGSLFPTGPFFRFLILASNLSF